MSDKRNYLIRLRAEIKANYPKEQLKDVYNHYLKIFDTNNIKKALSEEHVLGVVVEVFGEQKLFKRFYELLDETTKKILYDVTWENEISVKELEHEFNIKIVKNTPDKKPYDYYQHIEGKYHFFKIKGDYSYSNATRFYSYTFSFPMLLRKLLKDYLEPKPYGYFLKNTKKEIKTDYSYTNKDEILKEMDLYLKYLYSLNQTQIEQFIYKNINKTSTKFIYTNCNLSDEFYNLKELEYIKVELLTKFFSYASNILKNRNLDNFKQVDKLKLLIEILEQDAFFEIYNLLLHINGKANLKTSNGMIVRNRSAMESFFTILKNMTEDNFYFIGDILQFIKYRDLDFKLISDYDSEKLYVSENNNSGDKGKKYLFKDSDYEEYLTIPSIKGMFFLFSALGIIDIYYDNPKYHKEKGPLEYKSPFDNLKFIKLTELGAYLLDLKTNYISKGKESETKLILSEQELLITIEGKDKLKTMFLPKFAEQLSETTYKVTYNSFFKDCNSKKALEEKIKLFHEEISAKTPEIWNSFFKEILEKFNPLERQRTIMVFDISKDKKFIEILVKDDLLKKLVMKVEGQKIAIQEEDFPKVKKRLEQFGYLLPS